MIPFDYLRPTDAGEALSALGEPGSMALAGGTDLLPLWKRGVLRPARLVDISRLPWQAVEGAPDGVRIGALARLSDAAAHPEVRRRVPLVATALEASASPQVRNMATVGGALLQRVRCPYFRSQDLPCHLRTPGSGCAARDGLHRRHAIFQTEGPCIAAHPSDLAVALTALDATVRLRSPRGVRTRPVAALWRASVEAALKPDELVESIFISEAVARSTYLKVRDRAAFDFAVVSVAAVASLEGGVVRSVRLAAGGVAGWPWRLRASEAALVGRSLPAARAEAAALAAEGASPGAQNRFKAPLLVRVVARALEQLEAAP